MVGNKSTVILMFKFTPALNAPQYMQVMIRVTKVLGDQFMATIEKNAIKREIAETRKFLLKIY